MLGCSIGNPVDRANITVTNRQQQMAELYVPDNPQRIANQQSEGSGSFGKCAETVFWIFVRT